MNTMRLVEEHGVQASLTKPRDLVSGVVISDIMAIDICTFPSVRPPMILDQTNVTKDPEKIHRSIDSALPN